MTKKLLTTKSISSIDNNHSITKKLKTNDINEVAPIIKANKTEPKSDLIKKHPIHANISLKHRIIYGILLFFIFISLIRVPFSGAYLDCFVFEFMFGVVKYPIYIFLFVYLGSKVCNYPWFNIFNNLKLRSFIAVTLIIIFLCLIVVWFDHLIASWPEFEPQRPYTFLDFFDGFVNYIKASGDYSKFINSYTKHFDNAKTTIGVSGGIFAEAIYFALMALIFFTLNSFYIVFVAIFFIPLIIEAIFLFKKVPPKVEPLIVNKEIVHPINSEYQERHKVYHIGTTKVNLIHATKKISPIAIPTTKPIFVPPSPPVINKDNVESILLPAKIEKSSTKKIKTNPIKVSRTKEVKTLVAPQKYNIIAPTNDIEDETVETYDINYSYALSMVERIKLVIKQHNLNITFSHVYTMPLYSMLKFNASTPAEIEKLLLYKKDLATAIDLSRFVISTKECAIDFEVINPRPLKVSIHTVNDVKDLLFLGLDMERKPLALDSNIYSLAIFGKAGSGIRMLLSNIIASFLQSSDYNTNNVILLSCDKNSDTITNIYSDVNAIHHNIFCGSESCKKQLKYLLNHPIDKNSFIVIEDFNILIGTNEDVTNDIIELIKRVESAHARLIITAKTVNAHSGSHTILDALNGYITFLLATKEESTLLIGDDKACTLHGNGDGYVFVKKVPKIRFQSCYMSAAELKSIIDFINSK